MLIEMDMLLGIAALAVALPALLLQLTANNSSFASLSAYWSSSLTSNASAQRLVFQLGALGPGGYAQTLASSGYALIPFDSCGPEGGNCSAARLVTIGGKLYYLLVRR